MQETNKPTHFHLSHTRCYRGIYQNGSYDLCGSVSRERLKETTDKLPKCGLCNGTGYEKSRNTNETRICPMCSGKGYRTY